MSRTFFIMLPRPSIAFVCALLALALPTRADELISIRGAVAASEPVTAAAAAIKKETGLSFHVVTEGGSGGAVASIADEIADVALLSRKVTVREHASWPERKFSEERLGMQALVIVVPEQVWNAGVHSLTKDQFRDIYEGAVGNWKALGGADRKIVFYNRDVRSSAWELLVAFLYDDTRKAPPSTASRSRAMSRPAWNTTAAPSPCSNTVRRGLSGFARWASGSRTVPWWSRPRRTSHPAATRSRDR
jgi:ABC-type phosphate transport system substrate-binding protein